MSFAHINAITPQYIYSIDEKGIYRASKESPVPSVFDREFASPVKKLTGDFSSIERVRYFENDEVVCYEWRDNVLTFDIRANCWLRG